MIPPPEHEAELHHRFRSLIEHALDAFFIKDLQGRYLLINPAGARMLGRSVEEVLGRIDTELFPADQAAEIVAVDREVERTGQAITYQTVRRTEAGEIAFFTKKYPYLDRSGQLAGTMGVSHDVTSWHRAQEAARESDAAFRALIERSPDLVIVHSRGRVQYANRAAMTRLGHTEATILGTDPLHHVRPQDHAALLRSRVPSEEVAAPIEVGLVTAGDEVVLCELNELEVHWVGRAAQAYFARDITQRRRLEAHLAEADRLASLGTLAAGVAHEINNPLTFVLHHLEEIAATLPGLAADAVDRGDSGDGLELEALATRAAEAASGARRIARTVRDLVAYARDEGDDLQVADLARVLEKAGQMAATPLRHRARFVAPSGVLPFVRGNEARLAQVFVNLLVNAAQSITPGRADANRVAIEVHSEGDAVRVVVRDTGSGIPDALRDRIFDPFVTSKAVGEGTGLGLWVCVGILRRYAGRITMETELGAGSAFTVHLHRAEALPDDPSLPVEGIPAPQQLGRKRPLVLVVDDEELIGRLIVQGLSRQAEVRAVRSGREAMRLLDEGLSPDLILCDLMMPEVTGQELFAFILERHPALAPRVVIMTGGAFTDRDRRFLDAMQDRQLLKPFRMDDVRALLPSMVEPLVPQAPPR